MDKSNYIHPSISHIIGLELLCKVNVCDKTILYMDYDTGEFSDELFKRNTKIVVKASKLAVYVENNMMYDLIINPLNLHFTKDWEQAIVNMYNHVNKNGDLIFTIVTEKHLILETQALRQLEKILLSRYPKYSKETIESSLNDFLKQKSIPRKELDNCMNRVVFLDEIEGYANIDVNFKMNDRNDLRNFIRSLINDQSFINLFTIDECNMILELYLDYLILSLNTDSNGSYIYPMSMYLIHIKKH